MKRLTALLTAFAITSSCLNAAPAGDLSNNDIVIITKNGVEKAPARGAKFSKDSNGTLFLRSAVEPLPSPAPQKPVKPIAKPAPTPQHKAIPAPAAKPQKPAQKRATEAAEPTIRIQKKANPELPDDDLDEYSNVATIADPVEPVNRGTFWFNHQLYNYVLRPFSKAYEFVLPSPARKAIHNVFENAEYPVRVVNHALQWELKRADLETRKFVVNSVAGVGGILRVSDRVPELADVPAADTGQTLAKWGVGHGAYVVLPVLGPRSVRDTVGMAGDYALNPVSWLAYGGVTGATALAISGPNAARNVNTRMNLYDAATRDAIDPYIAVRSGYIQYREQAASK
ncbi:MAG: MlaA family lipoprotein [Spartobacteria bacterium]